MDRRKIIFVFILFLNLANTKILRSKRDTNGTNLIGLNATRRRATDFGEYGDGYELAESKIAHLDEDQDADMRRQSDGEEEGVKVERRRRKESSDSKASSDSSTSDTDISVPSVSSPSSTSESSKSSESASVEETKKNEYKRRVCRRCPEDHLKWRHPTIQWICGGYQRARRSFKSTCMMEYRNCQDGTMFTMLHENRCLNDTADMDRGLRHGKHFFYDYKVTLSGDRSSSTESESTDITSGESINYEDFDKMAKAN